MLSRDAAIFLKTVNSCGSHRSIDSIERELTVYWEPGQYAHEAIRYEPNEENETDD